jgi:hypothetical protein
VGRGWFLWLVQKCGCEVLVGEGDVKKDERWGLRGAWVLLLVSAEVRG